MEALHQDLVAVLPTGAGKTLIASMWLKRMRELNPEKMGLFVVDRIPLVLQQKKVTLLVCQMITHSIFRRYRQIPGFGYLTCLVKAKP